MIALFFALTAEDCNFGINAYDTYQGMPAVKGNCFDPMVFSHYGTLKKKYVPLAFHILGRGDGTELATSYPHLQTAIRDLNKAFSYNGDEGSSFLNYEFFASSVEIIKDDVAWNQFWKRSKTPQVEVQGEDSGDLFFKSFAMKRLVPDAINVFIMREDAAHKGYARAFPRNAENETPFLIVGDTLGKSLYEKYRDQDPYQGAWEQAMGSLFGLKPTGSSQEKADGSNGRTTGDLVVDTPADPGDCDFSTYSCTFVYYKCNGDYHPDIHNFMSAYAGCRSRFSQQQQQIMNCFIQNHSQATYLDFLMSNPGESALVESKVTVGCDASSIPTIQGAIDWLKKDPYSHGYGTIEACEGVYHENLVVSILDNGPDFVMQSPSITIQPAKNKRNPSTLQNVIIDGDKKDRVLLVKDGSDYDNSAPQVVLRDLTLQNGSAALSFLNRGGCVMVDEEASLKTFNVKIRSCEAAAGGGLYANQAHLSMFKTSIESSQADNGSAIYLRGSDFVFNQGLIANNSLSKLSEAPLGAIWLEPYYAQLATVLKVDASSFVQNKPDNTVVIGEKTFSNLGQNFECIATGTIWDPDGTCSK